MFKLALNAGHGINTPGKRCMKAIDPNETREWILNSRICSKIEQELKGYDGIEVRRMDDVTGNVDRSITERANDANAFGADLYLSIHHNAGINGGSGGGIEAYTYLVVDNVTKEWQVAFYNQLIANTGLKGNRTQPIKTADFGECRQTKMPAILLECGYMDSKVDTPIILTEDFANKVASACAQVIIYRAGLVKSVAPEAPKKVYRVRSSWEDEKSQTGAFTILQNAVAQAQKTGQNVYDTEGNEVWTYQPETPLPPQTPPEPQPPDDNLSDEERENLIKTVMESLKRLFKL